ncbi:hypothetical protein BpHYR1_015650, partial [Brachionus plicatilis]
KENGIKVINILLAVNLGLDLDFGIGKNRLPSNYEFSLNLILATRLVQYDQGVESVKLTAPPTFPPVKKQCPHCLSALVCTVVVRMSYCHCSSDQDHRHNTTA